MSDNEDVIRFETSSTAVCLTVLARERYAV